MVSGQESRESKAAVVLNNMTNQVKTFESGEGIRREGEGAKSNVKGLKVEPVQEDHCSVQESSGNFKHEWKCPTM